MLIQIGRKFHSIYFPELFKFNQLISDAKVKNVPVLDCRSFPVPSSDHSAL